MSTDLDALLPTVIDRFVDRMFDDFIIGFHFRNADRQRVKRHELQFARQHLLGEGRYEGRPIGALHRPLRINAGQFRRRLAILRTVATSCGMDPRDVERWIEHDRSLMPAIVDGTDCVP